MRDAQIARAKAGSSAAAPAGSPAWVAGPLSAGLGLAAHLAAGGQAPGLLIFIALAALLGMAASITASLSGGRRLPGWGVLLAAGLVQQLLHLAFGALSAESGFSFSGHHGGEATPQLPAPAAASGERSGAGHSPHLMLHLHVAAALVSLLATRRATLLSALRRPGRSAGLPGSPS